MTATSYLRDAAPPREPEPNRARRRVIVGVSIAIIIALALVWVVAFSSVFGVGTVTVKGLGSSGTNTVSADQVRAAAHVADGSPLVRLDTAAIAARVETIPEIASAEVTTSFPSTLTITVTERTAVGYAVDGTRITLLDRTGAQYRTVSTVPAKLPHFVLPEGSTARPTGAALARVASALPAALRAKVITAQAPDPDSISLSLRGNVLVQWGSAADSSQKARILPELLKHHRDLVHVVDVSDPGRPFTS